MNNRKLKFGILHFANYSPDFPGSFITTLQNLTFSLKKEEIDSILMFPVYRDWHSTLKGKGITVEIFSSPILYNPFTLIKLLSEFKKKIKNYNIKIIHCHFSRDFVLFSILYKILFDKNIIIIWHIHGWPATITGENKSIIKRFFRDSFYKAIGNWIVKYIVVSPELYKWLSSLCQNVRYIPNGISLEKFDTINFKNAFDLKSEFLIPPNSQIICSIANFRPEKDHVTLLKAVKEVFQQNSNVYLILVGDGPTKKGIEEYSETLGIAKKIIFTGTRKDIEKIIYFSDFFVLSTHGEGLPYVLCEAMASRKAVIATNVRGCRDVVTKESGILVEHKNYKGLAESILYLLNHPETAINMGKEGRKIVEAQFTLEKQSLEIINVYKEFI